MSTVPWANLDLRLTWLHSTVRGQQSVAEGVGVYDGQPLVVGGLDIPRPEGGRYPLHVPAAWIGGTPRALPLLEPYKQGLSMNVAPSRRVIVGFCNDSVAQSEAWIKRGCAWIDFEPREFLPLAGDYTSVVRDVAEQVGVYVGMSHPSLDSQSRPDSPADQRPVFWTEPDEDAHPLMIPDDFDHGQAVSVMSNGRVMVGDVGVVDVATRACLWTKGRAVLITTPSPEDAGSGVVVITDEGVVFGQRINAQGIQNWILRLDLARADLGADAETVDIGPCFQGIGNVPTIGRRPPYLVGFTERRVIEPSMDEEFVPLIFELNANDARQVVGDPINLRERFPTDEVQTIRGIHGYHVVGQGLLQGTKMAFIISPV